MISKEEVLNLAELARLKLSDEEVGALQKDISSILEYVGQVSTISTQATTLTQGSPRSDLEPVRNVMRADMPREAGHPMSDKEDAVKTAFPTREGEYNVVRKIIQKDEA